MQRKISVADSETDPFQFGRVPSPFIWGWYDGSEFHHFTDTRAFVEFCAEREQICYMHNGGKFDFHFLHEFMRPMEPIKVINGRIAAFKIGDCEFRDSYCILPVPLAAHDKTEIDYAIFEAAERNKPHNWRAIVNYLRDDCRSLFDFVGRYIDQFGLNITLASGALKTWRAMTDAEPPKSTPDFYDEFKPYYYGGRVEAIEPGEHRRPLLMADINSAYPYAMLSDHPYGSAYYRADEIPPRDKLHKSFISLRAESRGAFPYRGRDGSLSFPRDGEIREFHVTGHELLAAEETGALAVDDILGSYTFFESVTFREYVQRFYKEKYEAKARGDKAAELLAKLHLNSLYGKFGANPREYREYTICDPADIVAACEYYDYDLDSIAGIWAVLRRPIPDHAMHFYNVATAASVTGFVRAMLWRAICDVKRPLYVDTDSIICDDLGHLEIGRDLGQWDIEVNAQYAAIAGKKMYAIQSHDGSWKSASKGVRLSPAEIVKVARGETVKYESAAPTFSLSKPPSFITRSIARSA